MLKKQFKQVYSIFSIFLMLFQTVAPAAFFVTPAYAATEAEVTVSEVTLDYSEETNEFVIAGSASAATEYVLTYDDTDPETPEEASIGEVEPTDGIFEETVYAGTCSGEDCVADTVVSGTLAFGAAGFSAEYEIVDDVLWMQTGAKATVAEVELGKTYVAPQNNDVTVTFTALPENPGTLSIEEITLTDEQVAQLGALSNVAYDITSSMEDGTFEYELTLPRPEGSEDSLEVKHAESVEELSAAEKVETVEVTDKVTAKGLDHFTVFVVTSFEEEQTTPPTDGYNDIWFAYGATGAEVERVISGTNGITSSEGDYHAVLNDGAFTRWNGYSDTFPTLGFDTRVDVYLDMNIATGDSTKGFDFSSAINGSDGNHQRDFIFHLGVKAGEEDVWYVAASNNASASEERHLLSGNDPITVSDTGWYTLEHQFRANSENELVVTMNLYKTGESSPVHSWTRHTTADKIPEEVGGNRYGWFIWYMDSEDTLAIDHARIEEYEPTTTIVEIPKENTNWLFDRDLSTSSPFEFNSDESVIGTGSLYAKPISTNASDKFIAENFIMSPMGDVRTISYDFKIGSGGEASDENQFYLNVYANFAGTDINNYYDCKYDVVPTVGSTTDFTTVTFDVNQSYPVKSRGTSHPTCPAVPADMGPGANIRMFALNMGDTSLTDSGLDGYFDNVVVDKGSEVTIYDFEPMSVSAPNNLGWNLRSESSTPSERPVDVVCGATTNGDYPTYGNGQVSHNWETSESYSPLKYQRAWQAPGSSSWTADGTVYSATNTNFATFGSAAGTEGTWNTRVRSWVDLNGNNSFDDGIDLTSDWSNECTVTYDRDFNPDSTAPEMSDVKMFVNGTETWLTKPGDIVKIQATVTDPSGVDKVQVWVREFPWSPNMNQLTSGNLTNVGGDTWEFEYTVPTTYQDGDALNQTDGGNYFNFRPYDTVGNSHIGWRHNYTIDATNPIVDITSHSQDDVVSGVVTFEGLITELSLNNYNLALYKDGDDVWDFSKRVWQQNVTNPPAPTGDETTISHVFDTETVEDGVYQLRLAARDKAGNRDPQSNSGSGVSVEVIRITIDNHAPEISSVILNGQAVSSSDIRSNNCDAIQHFYTVSEGIDLSAVITDLSDVASARYNIRKVNSNGCTLSSIYRSSNVNMLEGSSDTWSGQFEIGNIPEDGEYTIQLTTKDIVGNEKFEYVDILVDTTEPSSEITSYDLPDGGEVETATFSGLIEGTATDATSGVAKVDLEIMYTPFGSTDSVYWNGSDWQAGATMVTANGIDTWDYQIPEAFVAEGIYEVTSHATDNAGNVESTYTIKIVYDKTIPEVVLTIDPASPDGDNGWYRFTEPTITLEDSDNYEVGHIEYQWNTTNDGDWIEYSGPFNPPSEGQNILYYRAIDKVGNVMSPLGVKDVKYDSTNPAGEPLNVRVENITADDADGIWEAPSDDSDVFEYKLSWKHEDGEEYGATVSRDTFEHVLDNLKDGVWTFTVRAVDAAGNFTEKKKDFRVGPGPSDGSDDGEVQGVTTTNPEIVGTGTGGLFGVQAQTQAEEGTESDETSENDAEVLGTATDEDGSVLGESTCAPWLYYLPLLLVLLQLMSIFGFELFRREPSMLKIVVAVLATVAVITAFQFLKDTSCYVEGSWLKMIATWFPAVAVVTGVVSKLVAYGFIEEA